HPSASTRAASAAVIVPLKLSGAKTTLMPPLFQAEGSRRVQAFPTVSRAASEVRAALRLRSAVDVIDPGFLPLTRLLIGLRGGNTTPITCRRGSDDARTPMLIGAS